MRIVLFLIALCFAGTAYAVQPEEMLSDPAEEARAREISKELRCLVCRNESIDDSSASLARDLRLLVRERISAGDDNEQTIDYIVDRYGEFVLLRPKFNAGNLVLWLAGPALLIIGGIGSFVFMRGRKTAPVVAKGLSDEEKRRLAELTSD
ncbi:MAG: cytochrome c-type biogenesis protein [Pikeienuella sp.]